MPGYEIMLNNDAFEQNKKNMALSTALSQILRNGPHIKNDQL